MIKKEKNNDTGLRILEVLKILLDSDMTKHELISLLSENSKIEDVYTQEAFIKYFNTLEALGFKINKKGKKYSLANAPVQINITKEEKDILIKMLKSANKLYNRKEEENFYKFVKRVEKYTNLEISSQVDIISDENKIISNDAAQNRIINSLMEYIRDNQLLLITYKKNNTEEETLTVQLKSIIEKSNTVYLYCYNKSLNRNKKIALNSILNIKQLSTKLPYTQASMASTVFELYGRLACIYKLKPNEKVIDYNNERLTISNCDSDTESLLKRLMKYGENCKVISPSSMRRELLAQTEEMLKKLEEVK